MATKRIRNFQRMRDFLEENKLYFPGMSYEAMRKAETEFRCSSTNEFQKIKTSLESLGIYETGMTFDEAKELNATLNASLQDCSVAEEIKFEESMEFAISESEKDYCYSSTMLNSIQEHEENWDDINEHVTNGIHKTEELTDANNNKIEIKVDVHHEFDWDPEKDLRRKMAIIALHGMKQEEKRKRSDSGIVSDANSLDMIEEVDPRRSRSEKMFPCKRKSPFSSWAADLSASH